MQHGIKPKRVISWHIAKQSKRHIRAKRRPKFTKRKVERLVSHLMAE
jgi:hypothetical protein